VASTSRWTSTNSLTFRLKAEATDLSHLKAEGTDLSHRQRFGETAY
jgi:hypothetical protein